MPVHCRGAPQPASRPIALKTHVAMTPRIERPMQPNLRVRTPGVPAIHHCETVELLKYLIYLAPRAGFEPATNRLTAGGCAVGHRLRANDPSMCQRATVLARMPFRMVNSLVDGQHASVAAARTT